ncbi:MAG: hypothetical protein KKC03_05085 [Bacteroidetes bacterium]|nr:hypothetical protein [Bacteroidota bacterium]
MDFKISKDSIKKYLIRPLIIAILIDLILVAGFTVYLDENILFFFKWLVIIIFIQSFTFYLPLFIFFSNYYKINKDVLLTLTPEKKEFVYTKGFKSVFFKEEDIESLTFYTSIPVHKNKQVYSFWLDYYYCILKTSKGSFVVTCLLCDELDKFVPEEKIIRKGFVIAQGFPSKALKKSGKISGSSKSPDLGAN